MFNLNQENFSKKIIKNLYNNDLKLCAKELDINLSTLEKLLSKNELIGINTFKKIINFCEKNHIDSQKIVEYK